MRLPNASVLVRQEWRLYPPLAEHFRADGLIVATSVSDPRGRRVELDAVAFSADLEDVRVVEAKVRASNALLLQAASRLAYAPRVYAAVPADEAERLLALAQAPEFAPFGLLAVDSDASVRVLREAQRVSERVEGAKRSLLERLLRGHLADGASRLR